MMKFELQTRHIDALVDKKAWSFFDLYHDKLELESFADYGLKLPNDLKNSVKKRQIDFLSGRVCALKALQSLGYSGVQRIERKQRAPLWPDGFTGSITHTQGYAAAIAGAKTQWRGFGIDAEKIVENCDEKILKYVCRPDEFQRLKKQHYLNDNELFTLIFSAKESLYKCVEPLIQEFFGFQAAQILDINPRSFTIEVDLARDDIEKRFSGSYVKDSKKITTLIALEN